MIKHITYYWSGHILYLLAKWWASHVTKRYPWEKTTWAVSKDNASVNGGDVGSRPEVSGLRVKWFGVAVISEWVHFSNIESFISIARAILAILVVSLLVKIYGVKCVNMLSSIIEWYGISLPGLQFSPRMRCVDKQAHFPLLLQYSPLPVHCEDALHCNPNVSPESKPLIWTMAVNTEKLTRALNKERALITSSFPSNSFPFTPLFVGFCMFAFSTGRW